MGSPMKLAHTPGPWKAQFDSCAYCSGEWNVDGPEGGAHGQFQHEADARLIAAAPELLKAVEQSEMLYAEYCALNPDPDSAGYALVTDIVRSNRKLLARITGESK